MRRLVWILLAVEAALLICALTQTLRGNAAVLLLAANSVLLLWSFKFARGRALRAARNKPSCCR
jgi:hypothetical protein